jgi:hypothetical protein
VRLAQDAATLYALWPDGTCERMGLSGQYNTSLTTMIAAVVNASNSAAAAAAINGQLAGLSGSIGGGGAGGGASDQMTQQVRDRGCGVGREEGVGKGRWQG